MFFMWKNYFQNGRVNKRFQGLLLGALLHVEWPFYILKALFMKCLISKNTF